jgi:hypothetical protein
VNIFFAKVIERLITQVFGAFDAISELGKK